MKRWTRFIVVTSLVPLALSATFIGAPPAHADRCEPTELVVRIVDPSYEEPIDEEDKPWCVVLINYVYPRLACDSSTLQACISTFDTFDTLEKNGLGWVEECLQNIRWFPERCPLL